MLMKSRYSDSRQWMYDPGPTVWTNSGTPDEINSGLERMQEAGISDVMITCFWSGPTWHRPTIEPNHLSVQAHKWDAIGYYLAKAKQMGIAVHAYFPVGLRLGAYKPEYAPPGTPPSFFNMLLKEYQQWYVENIKECLERYPGFAGVSLDFTRLGGKFTGEPWATRYLNETGYDMDTCYWMSFYAGYYADKTLLRTTILNARGINIQQTLPGFTEAHIQRGIELYRKWSKYTIERFMYRARAVIPDTMELSAYGATLNPEWDQGRDINAWLREGLIDTGLTPINFKPNSTYQDVKYGRRVDYELPKFHTINPNIVLILRLYAGSDSAPVTRTGQDVQDELNRVKQVYPDLPMMGYWLYRGNQGVWLTPDIADVLKGSYA